MFNETLLSAGVWPAPHHALASLLRGDVNTAAAHLEQMSWQALVALAIEACSPTVGPLAWAIWRKSNTEPDAAAACRAMRQAGYVPFRGYPLQPCADASAQDPLLGRPCLLMRPADAQAANALLWRPAG